MAKVFRDDVNKAVLAFYITMPALAFAFVIRMVSDGEWVLIAACAGLYLINLVALVKGLDKRSDEAMEKMKKLKPEGFKNKSRIKLIR